MMRKIGQRYQRTLRYPVSVAGLGYLTGKLIHVRFCPAPAHHGVAFQRTDRRAAPLPACIHQVTGANRRTVLGQAPHQVELVEHVLAALAGLKIDNCLIEISGPELPGLDGSALGFCQALCEVPLETQRQPRDILTPARPVLVTDGSATLTLFPATEPGLTLSYLLDYGVKSPLGRQRHTCRLDAGTFLDELCCCRTFLLEAEAMALRQQGIGQSASLRDLLVFGPRGPMGNPLRFEDEPARHKVLDMVGDLFLLGCDLAGHAVGCKSGHALNTQLVRELAAAMEPCAPLPLRRVA